MDGVIDRVKLHALRLLSSVSAQGDFQRHRVSISAAIALFGAYVLYASVTSVPRKLAHIPSLGFFEFMMVMVQRKSISDVSRRLTIPIGNKSNSGLYVRFDRDGWTVHITRPEAAKRLLFKTDIFPKADRSATLHTMFGRLLSTRHIGSLTGPAWKAHRKVAGPAFHGTMPVNLFGRLGTKLFNVMDALSENGEPIDFHDMTERWTLDALGLAAFDFDFKAISDRNNEWVIRYKAIMTSAFDPVYLMFPSLDTWFLPFFPERKQKHAELTSLLNMIDDIIAEKRKSLQIKQQRQKDTGSGNGEKDLLTMMIEAENEGQAIMSDQELRNNVVIFFIAGHDTTANALAGVAYELAVNQDIQAKAREEAIRVLGDASEDVIPSAEQFNRMTYIHQIIKENLRLHPPAASTMARTATEDTELAGVFIPKGTKVLLDIYELHHNPQVWSDPETFKPERFAPGGEAEQLAGSGMPWLPFINGARQCLGMKFTLAEQRTLLPMLLRKYELHLPENSIHKHGLNTKGLILGVRPWDLQIIFKRRY